MKSPKKYYRNCVQSSEIIFNTETETMIYSDSGGAIIVVQSRVQVDDSE